MATPSSMPRCASTQLLALGLCVSLNSRLESNRKEGRTKHFGQTPETLRVSFCNDPNLSTWGWSLAFPGMQSALELKDDDGNLIADAQMCVNQSLVRRRLVSRPERLEATPKA